MKYLFGSLSAISFAFEMAPGIPFAASVRINSAPSTAMTLRLSKDIDSGIVRISLYPFAAAVKASAIPVLPEVGSIMVFSFVRSPFFSASQIIFAPILHLTL